MFLPWMAILLNLVKDDYSAPPTVPGSCDVCVALLQEQYAMLATESQRQENKVNNQQAASLLKQRQCAAAAVVVAPLVGSKTLDSRNIYQPWETQKTPAAPKIHVCDDDVVESNI